MGVDGGVEQEEWWLDAQTKDAVEAALGLGGRLRFTVRPGTPLELSREQVGFG